MRYYAWYCKEIDVIILQCIMKDCRISFEWCPEDLHRVSYAGVDRYNWMPLGEL